MAIKKTMKKLRYLPLLVCAFIAFSGCKQEYRESLPENGFLVGNSTPEQTEQPELSQGDDSPVKAPPVRCANNFCDGGKCAVCQGQGKDNCGSFCTTCDGFGICDWCEGAGQYPPGFDINAVLGADHRTPSYKKGRCAVCNGVGRLCPTCRNTRLSFVAPTPYGIQEISCDCRYAVPCSNCAGSGQRLVQDMGVKKGDSQSAPPVDDEPVIVDVYPPVRTQPFPQSPLGSYGPNLARPVNTTSFSQPTLGSPPSGNTAPPRSPRICGGCSGSGQCRVCNGDGDASEWSYSYGPNPCSACNATGRCPICGGVGTR